MVLEDTLNTGNGSQGERVLYIEYYEVSHPRSTEYGARANPASGVIDADYDLQCIASDDFPEFVRRAAGPEGFAELVISDGYTQVFVSNGNSDPDRRDFCSVMNQDKYLLVAQLLKATLAKLAPNAVCQISELLD